jgi:phenylacetic acid degradation operon negative regulatory protein
VSNSDVVDLVGPLSARSIVASVLLGSHPPRLRGALLVAFAGQFGVAEGTTRVALSRMVDRGELLNVDGVYELAGDLLTRQQRQEAQRRPHLDEAWDGRWEQAVVTVTGRSSAERSRLRRALTVAGLGELREGVWLRPANLRRAGELTLAEDLAGHVTWFDVRPRDGTAPQLVATVFDLDGWAATARALIAAMDGVNPLVSGSEPTAGSVLAGSFRLAAAALQHLVHDPVLPVGLAPAQWPAADLRDRYDRYEHELQADLRAFFSAR